MVIIALVAGGGAMMLRGEVGAASTQATNERMDLLQKRLVEYYQTNGYLPCPADVTLPTADANYGVGGGTSTCPEDCTSENFADGNTVAGMVPVKTLQLEDKDALDGWGRRILYAVDERFTAAGSKDNYGPASCNPGSITVKDDAGGDVTRDGTGDVLVGAYAASPGGVSGAGSTAVVYGSTSPGWSASYALDSLVAPNICGNPWGSGFLANGGTLTAYEKATVPWFDSCTSETRTCNNCVLFGSYLNQACSVGPAPGTTAPEPVG